MLDQELQLLSTLRHHDINEVTNPLPVTFGVLRFYIPQMIREVGHLHGRGKVHLDINLKNWLVANCYLKLADFGVSRPAWSVQVNLLTMGSPDFSPPEMLLSERRVREFPGVHPFVVDAWHLGVCIINLKLGFNPFQTTLAQFRSIINQMEDAQMAMQPGDLDDMADPTYVVDGVHAIFLEYGLGADYYALPTPLVMLIDGTPATSNPRPSPTDHRPTSLDSPQAFSRSTRRTASTSRAPPISPRSSRRRKR